jgi:hypothetical protein
MKYLLVLIIPGVVLASTEIKDAKRSITALIQPLIGNKIKQAPKGTENFRVDGCNKNTFNWIDVLLMKETIKLEFTFKDGCDIEGQITPKIMQPFTALLNLRNLESYSRIETQNKVSANLETKPILNLEMRKGVLSGKKNIVKFEADYRVRISPIEQKTVTENLGGELRIHEINGKKVSIKEKILIK